MGYQNANLVAVWHGGLPGAAFKVLVRMALSSKDSDCPPKYHGGPGPLLLAIGRREVEPGDMSKAARAESDANDKALQRAIQPLRAMGLVAYAVAPVRGRTPEYWLFLEPGKGDGFRPVRGTETVPPNPGKGDGFRPVRGTETVPPEMKEQMSKPDEEKTNPPQVTTSPAARPPKITKPIGVSRHGCVRGWLPDGAGGRSADRCPHCYPETLETA